MKVTVSGTEKGKINDDYDLAKIGTIQIIESQGGGEKYSYHFRGDWSSAQDQLNVGAKNVFDIIEYKKKHKFSSNEMDDNFASIFRTEDFEGLPAGQNSGWPPSGPQEDDAMQLPTLKFKGRDIPIVFNIMRNRDFPNMDDCFEMPDFKAKSQVYFELATYNVSGSEYEVALNVRSRK